MNKLDANNMIRLAAATVLNNVSDQSMRQAQTQLETYIEQNRDEYLKLRSSADGAYSNKGTQHSPLLTITVLYLSCCCNVDSMMKLN